MRTHELTHAGLRLARWRSRHNLRQAGFWTMVALGPLMALATFAVLVAAGGGMITMGGALVESLERIMRAGLTLDRASAFDTAGWDRCSFSAARVTCLSRITASKTRSRFRSRVCRSGRARLPSFPPVMMAVPSLCWKRAAIPADMGANRTATRRPG